MVQRKQNEESSLNATDPSSTGKFQMNAIFDCLKQELELTLPVSIEIMSVTPTDDARLPDYSKITHNGLMVRTNYDGLPKPLQICSIGINGNNINVYTYHEVTHTIDGPPYSHFTTIDLREPTSIATLKLIVLEIIGTFNEALDKIVTGTGRLIDGTSIRNIMARQQLRTNE